MFLNQEKKMLKPNSNILCAKDLIKQEFIQVTTPGLVKDKLDHYFSGDKNLLGIREKFEWINEILFSDQAEDDFTIHSVQTLLDNQETYISFINDIRGKTVKPGEQVFFCYGNRANRYLMNNYGFCYKDNECDMFEFNVRTDVDQKNPPSSVEQMIAPLTQESNINVVRL